MVEQPLKQMTQKSKTMLAIVNFLYWASIVIICGLFIIIIVGLFLPNNLYHFEKSDEFWFINISAKEGGGFFIGVPFEILPSFINETTIVAKSVFNTMLTFFFLPFFIAFFYGTKQIKSILKSVLDKHSPFIEKNALRLKKLAWTVIIYSLIGKLLVNLMVIIFVTNIMLVNFDINFTGVFVGVSLLIIANIFQYGAFLQEEYDTTL